MSIYERFSEREMEILRARAERVVSAANGEEEGDVIPALVVTVSSETYALPIESLAAVYENVGVIPVPCVPHFVAGIANIRGHILPVVDLAALLNVPGEAAPDGGLVVVSDSDVSIALAVEAVGEVINFPRQNLASIHGNYLQGVTQDGTAVLDVAAILRDPALVVDETIG
jgi:purine-binding chemotaxis protein CheW